jgi:hypothetical protein
MPATVFAYRSVARIVNARVKELVKQRGRSGAEAGGLVELISPNSLFSAVKFMVNSD